MRLELISQIGGTGTRLMSSGLVFLENSGKIQEINGTRRDYSVPFRKVSSSTEFQNLARNGKYSSTLTGRLQARAWASSNHYSLVSPLSLLLLTYKYILTS